MDNGVKDYLNEINERFGIRRSVEQKEAFRKYVKEEAVTYGYSCDVEVLDKKHHNIVIGNPLAAKAVFTAHYDTPAAGIFPNLMLPRNFALSMLYSFGWPLLIAFACLGIAFIGKIAGWYDIAMTLVVYLVLYYTVYFYLCRGRQNKNNKNDNTSGVSVVMSLMAQNPGKKDIAFILFDNEEKGLLGSKAYSKKYKKEMEKKPLINLDCVGNGKHIVGIIKEDAENLAETQLLKDALQAEEPFTVQFFPMKGSRSRSDYVNFPCGMDLMAAHYKKGIGFYCGRIHTKYDTVADTENIEYLTKCLSKFVSGLEK